MGKAKKARASRHARHDPVGFPSGRTARSSSCADTEQETRQHAHQHQKAHKLLEELRSPDLARKEAAVVAMAQLLAAGDVDGDEEVAGLNGNERADRGPMRASKGSARFRALIHKLVDGGAVDLLMERMFDTASTVRLHGAGALRNMASLRDRRVTSQMVQAGVLTAVLGLLQKQEEEIIRDTAITTQGLGVLVAVCEGREAAKQCLVRQEGLRLVLAVMRTYVGAMGTKGEGTRHREGMQAGTGEAGSMVIQQCGHAERVGEEGRLSVGAGPAQGETRPQQGLDESREVVDEAVGLCAHLLFVATRENFPVVERLCSIPTALPFLLSLLSAPPSEPSSSSLLLPCTTRLHLAGCLAHVYLTLLPAQFSDARARPFPSLPRPDLLLHVVMERGVQAGLCVEKAALVGVMTATERVRDAKAALDGEGKREEAEGGGMEGVGRAKEEGKDGGGQKQGGGRLWRTHRGGKGGKREALADARYALTKEEERWEGGVVLPVAIALEVLGTLVGEVGEEEEEEEEEDEEEWDSDEDEGRMEAMAVELIREQGQEERRREGGREGGRASCFKQIFLSLVKNTETLSRVWAVASSLSGCLMLAVDSLPPLPTEGEGVRGARRRALDVLPVPFIRQVLDLRVRAILVLGGLLHALSLAELEKEYGRAWTLLKNMCEEGMEEEERGHGPWYLPGEEPWLGLVTGAMDAVVRRGREGGREWGGEEGDLVLLIRMLQRNSSFEVRVNVAGLLGGCCPVGAAPRVGKVLKEALGTETHVLASASLLNALMDVFGRDELDAVFQELKMLPMLTKVLPAFRLKAKTEAGKHGRDAVGHVKETALNLARFIKYKQR